MLNNVYRSTSKSSIFESKIIDCNLSTGIVKYNTIQDILSILDETSQSEKLHVYVDRELIDDIRFPYPFRSDNFSILLLTRGKVKIQLNLVTYELHANDLIIINPQTVVQVLEIEPGSRRSGIIFSMDFVLQNHLSNNEIDTFNFFAAKITPKLKLAEQELHTFNILTGLLLQKNKENNVGLFGDEMLSHSFHMILYEIAALYKKQYEGIKTQMPRKEELSMRFARLLNDNFKKQRTVQFYADALYVTTGHLTRVLKEISGKTAGQLIDDAVILEARILLSDPSLTVSQVANELQFSDQSFFGKFFKKNTGFSPSKYRIKK